MCLDEKGAADFRGGGAAAPLRRPGVDEPPASHPVRLDAVCVRVLKGLIVRHCHHGNVTALCATCAKPD